MKVNVLTLEELGLKKSKGPWKRGKKDVHVFGSFRREGKTTRENAYGTFRREGSKSRQSGLNEAIVHQVSKDYLVPKSRVRKLMKERGK